MPEQPQEQHAAVPHTTAAQMYADFTDRLSLDRKHDLFSRLLTFSRESFQPNGSAKLPLYLIDDHEAVGILDELQNELRASRREVLDAIQDFAVARCVRVQVYETRPQLACVIVDSSPKEWSKECSTDEEEACLKSTCDTDPAVALTPTAFRLHHDPEIGVANPHIHPKRLFFMRLKASLSEAWSDTVQRHVGSIALSGYPISVSLTEDIVLPEGPVRFLPHAKVRAEMTYLNTRVMLYEVPDDAPDADQIPLVEPRDLVPELIIKKHRIEVRHDEPLSADTLGALQMAATYDTEVFLHPQ